MTTSLDMIRGRSNVVPMTNNSGGALIAGDVCVQDATADENVTTTTSAASTAKVFIAAESIGIGAVGKFYESGYCPYVQPNASVTRGRFLFTHTVAKQAAENATYGAGAFGKILKSGTTPSAIIYSATAQISGGGVTRSGATTDGHLAVWNGSSADSIKDGGVAPISADGWAAATGTWTYSSADAPTYVISVNADMTTTIDVGQRIKLTDTTVKYFIVTAVGVFSGGNTLITVYGGTDYTLSGGAITLPYYSVVKAPFGFPLSPLKWTQEYKDTSDRVQATPTINVWYNINSAALSIPIGVWNVSYMVTVLAVDASSAVWPIGATLSTANNSSSDADWNNFGYASDVLTNGQTFYRAKTLALAAKTVYYLNTRTTASGLDNIYNSNSGGAPLIVRAVCAYL